MMEQMDLKITLEQTAAVSPVNMSADSINLLQV